MFVRILLRFRDDRRKRLRWDFVVFRDWVRDKLTAGQSEARAAQVGLRDLSRIIHPQRCLVRRRAAPERGKTVLTAGNHRYAVSFENLQRLGHVQDRLGARRDNRDGCLRQFEQVCRDIEAGFRAAVHAADAAGRKDVDTGKMCADHGGGDRRRAGATGCVAGGKVGARQFRDPFRLGKGFELVRFKSDVQTSRNDRNGRGRDIHLPQIVFDLSCDFEILREGHAMGDDGAFQRDNGAAARFGCGNFGGMDQGQVVQNGVSPET